VLEVRETEDPSFRAGRVSFSGIVKEVQLACSPDARPGDYVLVHVGFAIAVLEEGEARRTLELISAGDEDGTHPLHAPPPSQPTALREGVIPERDLPIDCQRGQDL
jgi:hydrogenase expression/formation protein HypC